VKAEKRHTIFERKLRVSARIARCSRWRDAVEVLTMKTRILLLLLAAAVVLATIAGCFGSCPLAQ